MRPMAPSNACNLLMDLIICQLTLKSTIALALPPFCIHSAKNIAAAGKSCGHRSPSGEGEVAMWVLRVCMVVGSGVANDCVT